MNKLQGPNDSRLIKMLANKTIEKTKAPKYLNHQQNIKSNI